MGRVAVFWAAHFPGRAAIARPEALCQFASALPAKGIGMSARGFNPVFAAQGTTIFTLMSALAARHGAINLGQGFPDEDGPVGVREAAAKALIEGPNQYPPMMGMPVLRKAIVGHAQRFYDLSLEPESETLVTSGATEALTASITALIAPGDEAVIIEPAYDSYRPALEAAGARVKAIRLTPPSFRLEESELASVFSPRTKLIVINSPLNPAGRVYCREELELLAAFLRRFDVLAICDEVYEHLVYDGRANIPLISLPGMRERCVRIGSAGKIFSLTGWKVGWVEGPAPLIDIIAKAHQFMTFTTPPALQIGVAHGLEHEMEFALNLTRSLQTKRDFLQRVLVSAGFSVLPCEGTYFLTTAIGKLTSENDRAFCERLTREAGVAAIPLSSFYDRNPPSDLIRFAVCKKQEVLEEAAKRLENYFSKQRA
jgi:aspartate/methionine/tyrosine aminotransferase